MKRKKIQIKVVSKNKNRFIRFREEAGLTRTEAAEKLGVDFTMIWRIENGERYQDPPLSFARKIARVYGTTVDKLFKE